MEKEMIQTHGEIAPRVIYVPERDAYADEQRSNGVNQREVSASLLVPIRGQPQSHDLHQETGPNYRDVFGSSSSHRHGSIVACLLLFQPFNLCFRFLTRRHALLLDTLNVSIHFFPRCLQSSAFSRITPCQLSTLSTSNRGCIIHDSGGNTLPSPGDDPRRQGIGFHQSFILRPKGWRGRKPPFQFSRRSKVF